MSNTVWRLAPNPRTGNVVQFRLGGGDPTEEMAILGHVINALGNRAMVQPSGGYYYNYNIMLASNATYQWLHSTLWSLLIHRLGIAVILR
jgi:hypothetical protein